MKKMHGYAENWTHDCWVSHLDYNLIYRTCIIIIIIIMKWGILILCSMRVRVRVRVVPRRRHSILYIFYISWSCLPSCLSHGNSEPLIYIIYYITLLFNYHFNSIDLINLFLINLWAQTRSEILYTQL